MQFGVLGPLTVTTEAGNPVVIPGAKVRLLLADLLTNRNHVVSADRLIDDLWGDSPPANASGALQVRVSQLRKALDDAEQGGRDLVASVAPGYVLRTDAVDADRFVALTGSGVDGLTTALALWRGDAYAEFADEEFVRAEVLRLTEQRLVAQERLAATRLDRGEHDLVVADLAELVTKHPLREGLRGLQIRALYAAGRQADALDSYTGLRERLAEELGLDPGPELVALHGRLLAQGAELSPAAVVRNSVPARLDELVGRDEALADVRALLPTRRLVTLIGPGGVGKTRLATEVAREHRVACLVELAPLPAGDGCVAERILTALDLSEAAGLPVPAETRLITALAGRDILIVLDNCEHVIDAAATLVGRVLREAPGVTVLATSREPLGLTGEVLWEVPPLPLPDDDTDVDAVRRSPAARLFTARAAAQQRTFRLDEHTAAGVAHLCRRLDGLPLALELAATRVRALGLAGVVARLDDRFALLTASTRDVPARQRTLTAVIAWSWDLLSADDQRALARLAVFRDGCTAEAAAAVCGTSLDTLAGLVDRSLVAFDGARYRLLESVAEFGLARLDDVADVRARHASYYTALAEHADPLLRGPHQREWLERLDAEDANLRAALDAGGGLRLANALTWYWYLRGRFTEARTALALPGPPADEQRAEPWRFGFAVLQGVAIDADDVRARVAACEVPRAAWFVAHALIERSELALTASLLPESDDPWTEAAVLSTRAMLAHATDDWTELERVATRGAALFEEIGDGWGWLRASEWLAGMAEVRGDRDGAAALHREGLRRAEELSLTSEVGGRLSWLAWLGVQTRAYTVAQELGERAHRMAIEQGSAAAITFAQIGLGFGARRGGKLDLAVEHLTELVDRGRAEAAPALFLPMVLIELGYATEHLGDVDGAIALHREAFDVADAMGSLRNSVPAIEGLASAAAARGDAEPAARLLGAATAARVALEAPPAPAEQDELDRVTECVTDVLGVARMTEFRTEGERLTLAEARALLQH
ncbi:BTAD domain-containing putative transcriptional regulator [Cryptosporangium sp. NPDC048952]|uniref:BTAD domain-containing putative transcriptional regulator n=1 Tax=Cryptosporangium sp. NPDC048952 TaxID=3363961 RepID=UPI0037224B72